MIGKNKIQQLDFDFKKTSQKPEGIAWEIPKVFDRGTVSKPVFFRDLISSDPELADYVEYCLGHTTASPKPILQVQHGFHETSETHG